MASIETVNGITFPQTDNDTILDAAEKGEVFFSYSCRTGRCSSCKCRVISGQTLPLLDEVGLTQKEKDEGWILSCARTAVSDLRIEVDALTGVALPKPALFPCKISSIEKLSKGVVGVTVRVPPNSHLNILPGQYVDIIGPKGVKRSYSVANRVTANILEFHVAEVEGGVFSNYWFNEAKPDDLLRLKGPFGTFFLRSNPGKDVVFLATGTGIAPVKAMIEGITEIPKTKRPKSVAVYWGGRTVDDLYLESKFDSSIVRFVPVLSRPSSDWHGRTGYVQSAFLCEQPELSDCVVYACGSDNMIRGSFAELVKAGLCKKSFFSDAFLPSCPT